MNDCHLAQGVKIDLNKKFNIRANKDSNHITWTMGDQEPKIQNSPQFANKYFQVSFSI